MLEQGKRLKLLINIFNHLYFMLKLIKKTAIGFTGTTELHGPTDGGKKQAIVPLHALAKCSGLISIATQIMEWIPSEQLPTDAEEATRESNFSRDFLRPATRKRPRQCRALCKQ